MTWAVEQELPALQKLVLLMLANCSNGHTGQCNPSHERLAKECGMSRTSVKDAIRALGEKGIIEIIHNVQDGVFLPNQYRLCMSTPPGRDTTGGESPDAQGVGRHAAIKQEVKPGSKTKAIKTTLPDGFSISEGVSNWAMENGFDRLEKRLAHFVGYVTANGKTYADWDAAFRNAIRDNWARLPDRAGSSSDGVRDACNPGDKRYVN